MEMREESFIFMPRRIIAGLLIAVGTAAPVLVGAVVPTAPPSSVVSVSETPIEAVVTLLVKLGGWFWGVLLALAVIFIVYAAFLFLTSGGDEEKVKKAKDYIIYAVVAVGVAILATGIVYLTRVFLGETTPQSAGPCRTDADCPSSQYCKVNVCVER